MRQYEVCELSFQGKKLEKDYVNCDIQVTFSNEDSDITIKAFYAGEGLYKVRFLPKAAGIYTWKMMGGAAYEISETAGELRIEAASSDAHGMVVAEKQHFHYEDGTPYYPFGTTIYALSHQEDEVTEETFATLEKAPFNKVRMCVFPKHYSFNNNEPQYYAFEKDEEGKWDVKRPCFAFWDNLEEDIIRLGKMGIEVDLILFHSYDRWGFATLTMEENLIYLDYLLRRLAAFPHIWWSLANEFDLCLAVKSMKDWEIIEEYTADNDPYHHLLSNHNSLILWDYHRKNITHVSYQTKRIADVPELYEEYQKPIVIDECCYEGNLMEFWGSISGKELTARFWRVMTGGGYCTHGETFLDPENEIIWWAKGGKLHGESPERIRFLKEIVYSLPSPIEPYISGFYGYMKQLEKQDEYVGGEASLMLAYNQMTEEEKKIFFALEHNYFGHCGEDAYLFYYDTRTNAIDALNLPEDKVYKLELIDTWNMTRETIAENASGRTMIELPGREWMAVLATRVK